MHIEEAGGVPVSAGHDSWGVIPFMALGGIAGVIGLLFCLLGVIMVETPTNDPLFWIFFVMGAVGVISCSAGFVYERRFWINHKIDSNDRIAIVQLLDAIKLHKLDVSIPKIDIINATNRDLIAFCKEFNQNYNSYIERKVAEQISKGG